MNIVLLEEYNKLIKNIDNKIIFALTPMAIFKLDKEKINYRIPEDLDCYPNNKVTVRTKEINDEIFYLNKFELNQTRDFWNNFIKNIYNSFEINTIYYFTSKYRFNVLIDKLIADFFNQHLNKFDKLIIDYETVF